MDLPLVSVIIPNYNYAHYLPSAIESVLGQTYPNIEMIVVDDGSSDDSHGVLKRYEGRLKTLFQKNQGVSAARNNGVAESRGELIAFLDADDYWLPQKVERQVERFKREPSLGLVHVAVDEIDQKGNSLHKHTAGLEGRVADRLLQLEKESIFGGGSGLMVRRDVFQEVGGFDLRLSTSADWDLFYQISSRHPVGFVPEILLNYRFHNSNMHSNVEVMEHDMSLAFDKALGNEQSAKSRASYGKLYRILAGSYFRAGKYRRFMASAVKSIAYRPANIFYFLRFPIRKFRTDPTGGQLNGTA